MALGTYYLLLICAFSYLCCTCVKCDLNLPEGSPCYSEGFNGTCLGVFKCSSAALTYLLANAGFRKTPENTVPDFPELPEICSYKNNEPVVCCTDCTTSNNEFYRDKALAPAARFFSNKGPIAWSKCLENFQRLPYRCRGVGNIKVKKVWIEKKKCHAYTIDTALAVGGRDAQRWEFPHAALIGYGVDVESAQWLCGGSIISERFILTAAHCTSTIALGNITFAALGLLKRTDPKKYWKIYKIKRIILHPEYKAPIKYHDIALLETENEINFGRDLLPACLDTGETYIGKFFYTIVEASGWGRLGHRKDVSDTLQVVYLEEYNETQCKSIYQPHRHLKNGYDHEKQMCYGSHEKIIDTCEGDSGGPMQINMEKCLYFIIGVTSYGKDCGILGSAGMYTRVKYYVPWIESVVWPEETEARRKKDNEWLDKWLNP